MYWLLFLMVCSGCMANRTLTTESTAEKNIYYLTRVSLGMTEAQVLQIMRQPDRQESFSLEEDKYDVWFYITRVTGLGQSRLVPQNLTPLVFKNGIFAGWGFVYYRYLRQQEKERSKPVAPVKPAPKSKSGPEESDDAKAIEKVLVTPKKEDPYYQPVIVPVTDDAATPAQSPSQPQKRPAAPSKPTQKPSGEPRNPPVVQPQQPPPPEQPIPTQPGINPPPAPPTPKPILTAMCSRPSTPTPSPLPPQEEEAPHLDEEGEKRIEEENEQNFDFW